MGTLQSKGRLACVDSLRGIASLSVLLFHARPIFWVGIAQTYALYGLANAEAWLGYASAPLTFGYLGRVLLFAVSGYGIHRAQAQRLAVGGGPAPDWKRFVLRRLWKIYPIYIAALLVTALVDHLIDAHSGRPPASYDRSAFTMLANLLTLQGWLAPQFGSNYPLWALAVILHIYAIYPLLYLVTRSYGAAGAAGLTLLAGLAYVLMERASGFEVPYPLAHGPVFLPHWFAWAVGLYVAEVEVGRARLPEKVWLLLVPLGFGAAFLDVAGYRDLAEFAYAPVLGGLLCWSISPRGQAFWSGLPGRLLGMVGLLSFSLYAIHIPCLHALSAFLDPFEERFSSLFPTLLVAAVAVAAAFLLFQLVERRFGALFEGRLRSRARSGEVPIVSGASSEPRIVGAGEKAAARAKG